MTPTQHCSARNRLLFLELKERFFASLPIQLEIILAVLVVTYILTVLIGPRIMAKRRPVNLKNVITVYNISQIVYNGVVISRYIKIGGFEALWIWREICCPITYGKDFDAALVTQGVELAKLYLFNKIVDLLETVFFILKKKNSQISFLHVYHHLIMIIGAYFGFTRADGEIHLSLAVLNSVVHFIMYIYYFMSAHRSMKPFLGWKKQLTRLQIAQFFIVLISLVMYMLAKCSDDPGQNTIWCFVVISFVVLFTRFYVQNYHNKSKNS